MMQAILRDPVKKYFLQEGNDESMMEAIALDEKTIFINNWWWCLLRSHSAPSKKRLFMY